MFIIISVNEVFIFIISLGSMSLLASYDRCWKYTAPRGRVHLRIRKISTVRLCKNMIDNIKHFVLNLYCSSSNSRQIF